jgi:hypothetical protein
MDKIQVVRAGAPDTNVGTGDEGISIEWKTFVEREGEEA